MVKYITPLLLILVSSVAMAQSASSSTQGSAVDQAVAKCLGSSSTTAGSKTACVQSAISNESTNQINTLYTLYTQFVAKDLSSLNSANGQPIGAGAGGGAPSNASLMARPAPAPATPAPSGATQVAPPPPAPTGQTAPKPNQGGIQYY